MKKLIATVTIVLAATGFSYGDDNLVGTYFCNPTASGGVAYRKAAWAGTKFTLPEPNIVSSTPAGSSEYRRHDHTRRAKNRLRLHRLRQGPVAPFITVLNCTSIGERWTITSTFCGFRYFFFGGFVDMRR